MWYTGGNKEMNTKPNDKSEYQRDIDSREKWI